MADAKEELFETPASEETPPEPAVKETEEQWETVAGAEEEEPKPEPAKEEEKPKVEKDDTFWRRERDQLLSAAKAEHPQWTNDWLAKRKQERKMESAPTVEDVAKGNISGGVDDQEFATKADINAMFDEVRSEIGKERQRVNQERIQEQYNDEYQRIDQALVAFRQKHNISNEEHEKLMGEALSFGANLENLGGPSAALRAYGKVATDYLQNRQGNQKQQAATSEAEQKALAAKMTMQPSGSAIGMQPKRKLTTEEEILDKMHAANKSSAAEELFG